MKKIVKLMAFGTLLISSNLMAQAYINLGVSDSDLNTDPTTKQEVTVTVTSNHGETESVVLTESDVDSSRFTGLVPIYKSNEESTSGDGKFNLNQNTNLKVTYNDEKYGVGDVDLVGKVLEADVDVEIAVEPTEPTEPTEPPVAELPPVIVPVSSGGGCTYNPNSNSFDMMFLFMMALGLLYPFKRRFLK